MTFWIPLIFACSTQNGTSVPSASGSKSAEPSTVDAAQTSDLDALRALGYLDYADQGGNQQDGLIRFERLRSSPGVTVLASRPNRTADLVNHAGETIHTWSSRDTVGRWVRARLLEGRRRRHGLR